MREGLCAEPCPIPAMLLRRSDCGPRWRTFDLRGRSTLSVSSPLSFASPRASRTSGFKLRIFTLWFGWHGRLLAPSDPAGHRIEGILRVRFCSGLDERYAHFAQLLWAENQSRLGARVVWIEHPQVNQSRIRFPVRRLCPTCS